MSCKAENCTNKSHYWIAHQGIDSVVCSERCGLELCPGKTISLIYKHHIYDDGVVLVHEKSPLITNVYSRYPMIATSRCVDATLEQARSQTHPGYYAVDRSTFDILHDSLIGPEQEGKKRGREEEEESSGKRPPAMTLEDLPDDVLIEMFLALEHGSQFDALRQTSTRFKRLSDRATFVRRQRAEKRNSDGTYVYKGQQYGVQTLTDRMLRKETTTLFADERHGIATEWYEDGQQESNLNYKDGKLNGVQRGWHENGKPWYEKNYKDGIEDGTHKEWYENEKPLYEKNYRDGIEDGTHKEWYENGKPKSEDNYKDGELDGVQKEWYENGQQWQEWNYKDGKQDGVIRGWHSNGQLHYDNVYVDGKPTDGVKKAWYENGKLKDKENDKDGEMDGVQKGWWPKDKKPRYEFNYKDGELDGAQKQWYASGQRLDEMNYKNGKKDGVQKGWHKNGDPLVEKNYKDGKKDGVQKMWNSTGQLLKDNYKDGVKQ